MNAQSPNETSQIKVLLIEDSEADALWLRELVSDVKGAPFSLECVDQLSKGLARLDAGGIDVVLLDLGLPDSYGIETFARAYARVPQVPIIVLSSLENDELALRAVQEGAQDYLVKNRMNSQALARVLRYAIERQHLQAEAMRYADALQASQAQLRRIIEESASGILIIDQEAIIRFANPAAATLFGRGAGELTGLPFGFPVVSGETAEIDILSRSHATCMVEMHVTSTEWDGQPAYLVTLYDITARKRAEEDGKKLLQMKDDFVASVSHELRTPLFTIQGLVDLLRSDKVPDPKIRQEFLDLTAKEIKRLSDLVNDLLDMSRLEAGQLPLDFTNVEIGLLIADAVTAVETLATLRDIQLRYVCPASRWVVRADQARLRQVLVNLISNAIKFSKTGQPVLITAQQREHQVRVEIIDQGWGIAPDDIPRLFGKFYRASSTVRQAVGGTGLGLYISKGIMDAHGGYLGVESELGHGSTFCFALPLVEESE
jgi:signal transduction histidine kinase